MRETATKGYLVRTVAEAPTFPCPCGQSTRPLTAADGASCSLHVTSMTDATRHNHRVSTEVYYILEGSGKMELNEDVVDVGPGTVVLIEPGTRHRLVSPAGIRSIVFAVPPFRADDEYFD